MRYIAYPLICDFSQSTDAVSFQNAEATAAVGCVFCNFLPPARVPTRHGVQKREVRVGHFDIWGTSPSPSPFSEFLNAGTDTTSTMMQWILANLVKNQDKQAKLVEEIEGVVGKDGERKEEDLQKMSYLKAVIMEGLRKHPPGHFVLPHAVSEEVTLNGYTIPKNASTNFTVVEIGLDKEVWEDPLEFRPERFLNDGEAVDITGSREIKMMPFGAGRRICPGLGLAMLHLEYFVANLVREFEWKPKKDGEMVDFSEKFEFTVVMKNPLEAKIISRRR